MSVEASPGEWIGSEHETPESLRFVGMEQAEAIAKAREWRITKIRVLDSGGSTYTTDLRPDRLDLLVKDGVVIKAAFF